MTLARVQQRRRQRFHFNPQPQVRARLMMVAEEKGRGDPQELKAWLYRTFVRPMVLDMVRRIKVGFDRKALKRKDRARARCGYRRRQQ